MNTEYEQAIVEFRRAIVEAKSSARETGVPYYVVYGSGAVRSMEASLPLADGWEVFDEYRPPAEPALPPELGKFMEFLANFAKRQDSEARMELAQQLHHLMDVRVSIVDNCVCLNRLACVCRNRIERLINSTLAALEASVQAAEPASSPRAEA